MGRGMQVAVLGAVVAGSLGGSLAALAVTAEPPARSPAQPSISSATAIAPPPPAPQPPDPRAATNNSTTHAMRAVLARFAAWSRDHAGEPCPDLAALGIAGRDPWGHPLRLTCTDQPADQRIGAISQGPDGVAGSDDDLTSWTLGREVTELVRGPRWQSASATPPAGRRRGSATASSPTRRPPVAPPPPAARNPPELAPPSPASDASADDIPMRR